MHTMIALSTLVLGMINQHCCFLSKQPYNLTAGKDVGEEYWSLCGQEVEK